MKKVLISGITGQDGSYLADLLLSKGYEVHGMMRRVSLQEQEQRLWRIRHILDKIKLHQCTLESYASIYDVVARVMPDECYHLAAQSMVMTSFEDEYSTLQSNTNGTHFILASLRNIKPDCRFYFAGSSEMFGDTTEVPQSEITRFNPCSPYAISKVAGFHLTKLYRECHGMFALSGILFNHESPRRSNEFVTRKITQSVARISLNQSNKLVLGNINAKRDWGYAPDYVDAMHRMLQLEKPDDFCICTGQTHTVEDFVKEAFSFVGIDDWKKYTVYNDESLIRPNEVNILLGNYSKAKHTFGWQPEVGFSRLVEIMMLADLKEAKLQA